MEAVLQEVNAAVGVTGSFVVGEGGRLEARSLPDRYSTQALEVLGRTLVQTLGGIELARRRRAGDLDMGFADGRLLVRNLSPGCLCILTAARVNVALVNLTGNVAVKKIKDLRKDLGGPPPPSPVPAAAPATPAPSTAPAAVDGRAFSVIERELARAIGNEARLVLYYEVAAMGLSKSAFPPGYLGDLIERLSGEIDDPVARERFLQDSRQVLESG